jgi:hypothetical protein
MKSLRIPALVAPTLSLWVLAGCGRSGDPPPASTQTYSPITNAAPAAMQERNARRDAVRNSARERGRRMHPDGPE